MGVTEISLENFLPGTFFPFSYSVNIYCLFIEYKLPNIWHGNLEENNAHFIPCACGKLYS